MTSLSCCCRLYSCLANGSPDEFQRGEQLYRIRAVKDPLQIGGRFQLSYLLSIQLRILCCLLHLTERPCVWLVMM